MKGISRKNLLLPLLALALQLFLLLPAPAIEADIHEGAIVEGSSKYGGLQPDYLVDFSAPEFDELRRRCREVGKKKISKWKKIDAIKAVIRWGMLPRGAYNDPGYLRLMRKYREENSSVPLSAYVKCGAGVCRENAMITHLALKEAGIESKFVYAKVQQVVFERGKSIYDRVEDHAFNIVTIDKKRWIVDSYNENFHGFSYDQLQSPDLNPESKLELQPGAKNDEKIFRRVVQVNNFPKVIPSSPCEQGFRLLGEPSSGKSP